MLDALDAKLGIGKPVNDYWSKGYALENERPAILKPIQNISEKVGSDVTYAKFPSRMGFINWVKDYSTTYTQDNSVKNEVVEFLESLTSASVDTTIDKDVRKAVLNSAVKMGINAGSVLYDTYKYSLSGTVIDPARLAQGNPECYLVPENSKMTIFYELFVNISIPGHVDDDTINRQAEKLVSALSMLEEVSNYRIQYKVTLIDISANWLNDSHNDMMVSIPVYSHNDNKDKRLLKTFFSASCLRGTLFMHQDAVAKELNDETAYGRGQAVNLNAEDNVISLWEFDERDLFSRVVNDPYLRQHIPEMLQ